jgi:hypothetical protein
MIVAVRRGALHFADEFTIGTCLSGGVVLDGPSNMRGYGRGAAMAQSGPLFMVPIGVAPSAPNVELVVLIHNQSGLLLNLAVQRGSRFADPDNIAGPLHAVRRRMLEVSDQHWQAPEEITHEDLKLYVEVGARTTLCCVADGTYPAALRDRLRETLIRIHTEFGDLLTRFAGDASRFKSTQNLLEAYLTTPLRFDLDPPTLNVEQVMLIHNETGILLSHAVRRSVRFKDPDLVAGQLETIRQFIAAELNSEESIEDLQVGDLKVCIERGLRATLCCVVRGTYPAELRHRLQDTLFRIHGDYGDALNRFTGDMSPFEGSRDLLEDYVTDLT